MSRWNVGKVFQKITLEEFQDYAGKLKTAFESNAGTECDLNIEFFNGIPFESSMDFDFKVDHSDKIFSTANDLNDVLQEDWDKAVFVKVKIESSEIPHTYAVLHAKGLAPKKMSAITDGETDDFKPSAVSSDLRVTASGFHCGYPNMGRG